MVILGTQYAGEMKKGILTLMMYQVRLGLGLGLGLRLGLGLGILTLMMYQAHE